MAFTMFSKTTFASLLALPLLACLPLACSSSPSSDGANTTNDDDAALATIQALPHKDLCDSANLKPGVMHCHAKVRTTASGSIQAFAAPSGIGPADLVSAYKLAAGGGEGKTIAIVDAQDDPKAESDLATYRSTFGLPPCTTANGCFKKVNQSGQASPLPTPDDGWAGEIALDLDMASAVCPECKILLVEATTADNANLGAAVNTAVALGATVVSNSYGGGEDNTVNDSDQQFFNHPGVAIFASSGDSGFNKPEPPPSTATGASYPASSAFVIGVGGTSLVKSTSSRGWAEKAWNGAGSGCSLNIAKPGFQNDPLCTKKTVADVSAVADPNTGVAVFNTQGAPGWQVFGGTSASSPIVASIFAKTGNGGKTAAFIWANTGSFFDVTSGSNGSCSSGAICTAKAGFDGPTGWGSPNASLLGGGTVTDGGTPDTGTDAGQDSGTDAGGTCAHSDCSTGTKLVSTCDPCVAKICAADSFCCNSSWDSTCVGEVKSICGQTCGGTDAGPAPDAGTDAGTDAGGTCAHSECTSGAKLAKTCDACVTKICTADSFCCSSTWDSICVSEVGSICGQTCN